jgi:predicted DNA-binding transcriptional regulator AlpA
MKKSHQKKPDENVFYYTWLVSLSLLDDSEKDNYDPNADYVTKVSANDDRFLQKGNFIFWGTYSYKNLRKLLDLFVYKQCMARGTEQKADYFVEWLNHTISISKTKVPELVNWCEAFNIENGLESYNPPKYVSIRQFNAKGEEFSQQTSIDVHFGIINSASTTLESQTSAESTAITVEAKHTNNLNSAEKNQVSTEEAAQMLGKSKTTLWRWENEGYLVPVKVGRSNRYKMEDIQAILDGKPI